MTALPPSAEKIIMVDSRILRRPLMAFSLSIITRKNDMTETAIIYIIKHFSFKLKKISLSSNSYCYLQHIIL